MRRNSLARWATCAIALSICIPTVLAADNGKKSIAACTTFDQTEKGDDKVEFTIKNSCTIPVDCTVTWRVVCAPDSKKRRAIHPGSSKFALTESASQSADASAAVCGDDAFAIDQISWNCQPNKD